VIFIITGIGSINKDDAKEFLKKAALIMLLIWILGIIGFHFMDLWIENWEKILRRKQRGGVS
jgi:hypothetical protein